MTTKKRGRKPAASSPATKTAAPVPAGESNETQESEAALRRRIAEIDRERALLSARLAGDSSGTPRPPLWMLIRDHLTLRGGTDSVKNIVDALLKAGHDLGKYPLRSVKQSLVSPTLKSVFVVSRSGEREMVALRHTDVTYMPHAAFYATKDVGKGQ